MSSARTDKAVQDLLAIATGHGRQDSERAHALDLIEGLRALTITTDEAEAWLSDLDAS